MEQNTVILSLDNYNDLREFKEKIEQDYTFYVNIHYTYKLVSKSETVKDLTKEINKLSKEPQKLKNEIYDLSMTIKRLESELSTLREPKTSFWCWLKF